MKWELDWVAEELLEKKSVHLYKSWINTKGENPWITGMMQANVKWKDKSSNT